MVLREPHLREFGVETMKSGNRQETDFITKEEVPWIVVKTFQEKDLKIYQAPVTYRFFIQQSKQLRF